LSYRSNAREIFEHALTTTMRAIAKEGAMDLPIAIASRDLNGVREQVSRLPDKADSMDIAEVRGNADSAALKHRYHDSALHRKLMPAHSVARDVFNAIEEARVEAIGAIKMQGVRANLAVLAQKRVLRSGVSKRPGDYASSLSTIVGLIVRERLTGEPPPEAARRAVESQRRSLELRVGHLIDSLNASVYDQKSLSLISLRIIEELVGDDSNPAYEEAEPDADDETDDEDFEVADIDIGIEDNVEMIGHEDGAEQDSESVGDPIYVETEDDKADPGEGSHEGTVPWRPPESLPQRVVGAPAYKVFTDAYDVVVNAEDVCEATELENLRNYLDEQMVDMSAAICKLANRLQRRLLAYQRFYWQFDLDEGALDTQRLSRVITSPQDPRAYKRQTELEFKDTVVTLLLDNSGSMRGRPILTTAVVADVLTRTLERCGVKVEILGFTTADWQGGRSHEAWILEGKPDKPGRLNDLLHIIYKSADASWRRSRRNLGLMMREGLLKENIDGEALLWAHGRLIKRNEERRILMVISDGAPVDDSTLTENSKTYLDSHLQKVIHWIETCSSVELNAIGIGHDVTRYYSSSETVSDVDQLASAMTGRLAALFERNPPRPKIVSMGART
jgi:cobaltochelatase CobT